MKNVESGENRNPLRGVMRESQCEHYDVTLTLTTPALTPWTGRGRGEGTEAIPGGTPVISRGAGALP